VSKTNAWTAVRLYASRRVNGFVCLVVVAASRRLQHKDSDARRRRSIVGSGGGEGSYFSLAWGVSRSGCGSNCERERKGGSDCAAIEKEIDQWTGAVNIVPELEKRLAI